MPATRRTPWYLVDGLEQAVALAGAHGPVLVVDIENTLVGYGSTAEERATAMDGVLDTVVADGRLTRLAFVSNGRFDQPLQKMYHSVVEVNSLVQARKPYIWLPPLRAMRAGLVGATVYGDQPLTDGRLARALGGIWLQPRHAAEVDEDEPWYPRMMRRRGQRIVGRSFARIESAESSAELDGGWGEGAGNGDGGGDDGEQQRHLDPAVGPGEGQPRG
jgi:hypothetical protein